MKILGFKQYVIPEMKNSLDRLNSIFEMAGKESMNSKDRSRNYILLKNRMGKD